MNSKLADVKNCSTTRFVYEYEFTNGDRNSHARGTGKKDPWKRRVHLVVPVSGIRRAQVKSLTKSKKHERRHDITDRITYYLSRLIIILIIPIISTSNMEQEPMRFVWYMLVDFSRNLYKGTSATKTKLCLNADIDEFRGAVKGNNSNTLSSIDSSCLLVFSDKASFDNNSPLSEDTPIGDFGRSKQEALFVLVPCTERPIWRKESPTAYSIEERNLFFVNRKTAVDQLYNIQYDKFKRAETGRGRSWVIPLIDNIVGIGKSAFALNYINQCRQLFPEPITRNQFQKTLCNCRTLKVVFRRGSLLTGDPKRTTLHYLIHALKPMFENPPAILTKPPERTDDFLVELTALCGPVFIVLDEIGRAFDDDENKLSDLEKRKLFFDFCESVVGNWLSIEKVFFVLVGRGSFLSYVGDRPTKVVAQPSPFIFRRLSLHMLRPNYIADLLGETSRNGVSLVDFFRLKPEQVNDVARLIFQKSFGHPRTLLDILTECESLEQLERLEQRDDVEDWGKLASYCRDNRDIVIELFEKLNLGIPIDLSCQVERHGRVLTYDILVSNLSFAWEGEMKNAKLCAPPFLIEFLRQMVLPLRDYLKNILSISAVSINYPTVFEWMFVKRFQEMFVSNHCPGEVLAEFLGTARFGKLSLKLSPDSIAIPKVTENGNRNPKLTSDTVHPESLGKLMMLLDRMDSICGKPLPLSASPDAIFFTNVAGKRVSLGIAVKNFTSTSFSNEQLADECKAFNRMFVGAPRKERLNILIICATKYIGELSGRFGVRKFFSFTDKEKYPFVDEVVVLNLMSREALARFFGFEANDPCMQAVDIVIKKIEAEFN